MGNEKTLAQRASEMGAKLKKLTGKDEYKNVFVKASVLAEAAQILEDISDAMDAVQADLMELDRYRDVIGSL